MFFYEFADLQAIKTPAFSFAMVKVGGNG